MSCVHPLKGFIIGKTENGKNKLMVTPYKVNHLEKVKGLWTKCFDEFKSPSHEVCDSFVEVPCGRCIECRLEYSRQWANRMMFELQDHDPDTCWFVTLTYNDENLPLVMNGEQGTLVPDDMTLFLKRLRDNQRYHYDEKIRYFYCGEYGSLLRPHYHAIIYNLHLSDVTYYGRSKAGNALYLSEYLKECWGKGFVLISPVTWDTCAYTARYVLKKTKRRSDDENYLEYCGVCPEFVRMSRKPGLGANAFSVDMFEYDWINLKTDDGGIRIQPPKIYERMFEEVDEFAYKEYKDRKCEAAEVKRGLKLSQTDLTYTQLLEVEEMKKENAVKALKRNIY